jgi:hypothetical protein
MTTQRAIDFIRDIRFVQTKARRNGCGTSKSAAIARGRVAVAQAVKAASKPAVVLPESVCVDATDTQPMFWAAV